MSKNKKIMLVIIIIGILVLDVLASIGISSITKDYNYFGFTIVGIVLLLIIALITFLIKLIKDKMCVLKHKSAGNS